MLVSVVRVVRAFVVVAAAFALLALPGRAAALEVCVQGSDASQNTEESPRIDGHGGEFSGFDAAPDGGRSALYHLTVRPGVHTFALPIGQCYLGGGFNGDDGTSTFSGFRAVATDLSNHSVLGRDIRFVAPAPGDLGAPVVARRGLSWPGASVSWNDRQPFKPITHDLIGYAAFRLDLRRHGSYVVRFQRYDEHFAPIAPAGGGAVDGPYGGFEAILQVSVKGKRLPNPTMPDPPVPSEPKPPIGSGYSGPPTPVNAAGCTPKVSAGELEGVSACWRAKGDVFTSDGRARINGIDFTPARRGIAIKIDRGSQRISSTGPVEVRVGPLELLRATINWRSRKQIFSIAGKSAKKDEKPKFDVKKQEFLGLAISGSAELTLEGGETKLKVAVEVPEDVELKFLRHFAGWSGELTAAATNDAGLVLDAAMLNFPSITFGGFIDVQNASLVVSRQSSGAYHWDGGATVYPFRNSTAGLIGKLGWGRGDGYFKLGAGAEQLNKPLFDGIELQKLFLAFQRNPFGLSGSAGITFGPQFRLGDKLISSARLDGGFAYVAANGSDPRSIAFDGNLEVLEAHAADGKLTVQPGKIDASGNFEFEKFGYGFRGAVSGWFDRTGFDLEGRVGVSLPGPDEDGEAVMSGRGVGACRHGFGPDVGFGYRWGKGLGGLDVIGRSCDLGNWRQARASAAQAGAPAVHIGRTRTLAIQVSGQGTAPLVSFTSPSGRVYLPDPDGSFADVRALLFRDPATQAEYLAIDKPARGNWKIQALPGSVPVTRVRSSVALAPLRIRARVSGHGAQRTVRYQIGHRGPASIAFYEQGRTSRKRIGTARGSRGRLRLRPAVGAGGTRRVVAVISRFGHPVQARRVAAFRTGRVRLPRAQRVRIARHGSNRVVSWRGPPGRYVVEVRTSDGRHLRYVSTGNRHRVTVDMVPRRVRVRANVSRLTA